LPMRRHPTHMAPFSPL